MTRVQVLGDDGVLLVAELDDALEDERAVRLGQLDSEVLEVLLQRGATG
jgi:hypothetical protein